MGEYAMYGLNEIKIGTCESMYYLRYEDREHVEPMSGNVNPAREKNLFWRLPYPDEDTQNPGTYEDYNRGERLYKKGVGGYCHDFHDPELAESPGIMQMSHPCGLLVNVPCYHGEKLPDLGDAKTFWNGKSWFLELAFVKNTDDGVLPVVRCRHCGSMWRYTWDEVLPYVHGKMKTRLEKHS